MTDKEKRKAVHDYQFVVYTPQKTRYVRTEHLLWEISGHLYPYRRGKFDYTWLEAFRSKSKEDER